MKYKEEVVRVWRKKRNNDRGEKKMEWVMNEEKIERWKEKEELEWLMDKKIDLHITSEGQSRHIEWLLRDKEDK